MSDNRSRGSDNGSQGSDNRLQGWPGGHSRRPLNQHEPGFHDTDDLNQELARVFDICHGCRRCVNLCNTFPTLFKLIDESPSGEVDGVSSKDYQKAVDQCYLCDLCYRSKCPYVPPHEWNMDFPQSMLRAKVVRFEQRKGTTRDRLITSTDTIGRAATLPLITSLVNGLTRSSGARLLLEKTLNIHKDAPLPRYSRPTFRNNVEVRLASRENCCAMPKLELGDLQSVDRHTQRNVDVLYPLARAGWTIIAAVPSCVLMFRQTLPTLYPDDDKVQAVAEAFCDPFEFLQRLHRRGRLNLEFKRGLGTVSYHVACHQRAQGIGPRTQRILELIPDTRIKRIERCSGHNGTYAVKQESHDIANSYSARLTASDKGT